MAPRLGESELMRTGTPTGETMAPAWRAAGTGEGPFTGSQAFVPRAVAVEDVAFYLCVCVCVCLGRTCSHYAGLFLNMLLLEMVCLGSF